MRILTPLAVIAVCIGMYFLYITPSAVEVSGLIKKKNEYYDVLQKAKELTSKRDELATTYNSIPATDLDRLAKMVPEKLDPVLLANDVNALAVANRLKIQTFKTGTGDERPAFVDPQEALPYKVTSVSMVINGQYADFLKFLSGLETSLRLLDVVDMKVEAPSDATVTGSKVINNAMNFTLQINTYSLK
jgi:Tfp pilus assembly protein PilO